MKRGEWHERARQLHAEHPDWSNGEIARTLGVTKAAVWRVLNPEKTRESRRRDNARRRPAKREWERAWLRSAAGRGVCVNSVCRRPRGVGAMTRADEGHCESCWHAIADVRRTVAEGMWADGWPLKDMAVVFGGVTPSFFAVMRGRGWDLPHRYRMDENGRRLPDDANVRAAR